MMKQRGPQADPEQQEDDAHMHGEHQGENEQAAKKY